MKKRLFASIAIVMTMVIGVTAFAQSGLTQEQFLTSYLTMLLQQSTPPQSAKYIQVRYHDVPSLTLYHLLQQAIVLDMFPNANVQIDWNAPISQQEVAGRIDLAQHKKVPYTPKTLADNERIQTTFQDLSLYPQQIDLNVSSSSLPQGIFYDVYDVLHSDFADSESLSGTQLRYGAIKGMVDATNDIHTNFFTPQEAQQFTDEIAGEFQGIGAYVEMKTPGVVSILNPIPGSPAQSAGLKAKDQIIQVDDHIVTSEVTLSSVINRIKGPLDTTVKIKILRDNQPMTFTVKREKIIVPDMETKEMTGNVCYIALHSFDTSLATNFALALNGDFSANKCASYIFDMRDNPGGSLEEVTNMLNYIVPTGSPSVQIVSKQSTDITLASAVSGTKITDKPMEFLINGGSASAAEIFVASSKEYAPYAKVIGEKSYGKGTVQTVISYLDGSMLKYTIAKRYTGKNKINVDKKGITPDITVSDDSKTPQDEVLEYALKYATQ